VTEASSLAGEALDMANIGAALENLRQTAADLGDVTRRITRINDEKFAYIKGQLDQVAGTVERLANANPSKSYNGKAASREMEVDESDPRWNSGFESADEGFEEVFDLPKPRTVAKRRDASTNTFYVSVFSQQLALIH
jgi:hypothetical protein